MKDILWNNKARKQMKKIPINYRDAIFQSVDKLKDFPGAKGLDVKALRNHKYDYRMRVGRYRVLFDDKEQVRIIAIQEVKKRDNSTY
ncbi:MAG: type II toxin-antitoxin system RelE/ParE family toxin [Desulfobacterales bacterium]|nr:type II toxin-antitoxin system RelE/ParE family toxin [Desulfobacterales bacterium]